MDKSVYCVFKLVDGESIEVGNASDSFEDAKKYCRDVFYQEGKKYPVKVVETKVVHDVVFALAPPSFHVSVRIPSTGSITHYRNYDDFISAVSSLVRHFVHFDVVSYES